MSDSANPRRNTVRRISIVLAAITLLTLGDAQGVILLSTGDSSANTTAPSGDLAGSGWQYQGFWGAFLGTPIAPDFFISAGHIGNAGNSVFTYQNVNYSAVTGFSDPFSDLMIWQILAGQTFPLVTPIYTSPDEVGKHLVVMGRGTQRGDEVTVNGTLRGWTWGPEDHVERWGENIVAGIVADPNLHELIYAPFDANGLPGEAQLSSGDSGGAVFISKGGIWKLAAINYGVDSGYYTDANGTNQLPFAALFDTRDLFFQDAVSPPHFTLISGAQPVPTAFYSTRISTSIDWIYSVIDPAGDQDGNGTPNLLQYALALNAPPSPGYGATQVETDGVVLSLTYRKITTAAQLQYVVQQSTDLTAWSTVTPREQMIATRGNVQTIKASVPVGPNDRLFLRLRITQSAAAKAFRATTTSRRDAYKTGNAR